MVLLPYSDDDIFVLLLNGISVGITSFPYILQHGESNYSTGTNFTRDGYINF